MSNTTYSIYLSINKTVCVLICERTLLYYGIALMRANRSSLSIYNHIQKQYLETPPISNDNNHRIHIMCTYTNTYYTHMKLCFSSTTTVQNTKTKLSVFVLYMSEYYITQQPKPKTLRKLTINFNNNS